jgi:hypothetical protein
MKQIKPIKSDWTPSESASVNEFLNTPVGIRWLQELFKRRPWNIDRTSAEKAALDGCFLAGYEKAWEEISNTRVILPQGEDASVPGIDPTKD